MSTIWPRSITIVRHGQSARNVMKEQSKLIGKQHSYVDGVRDQDTPLTTTGHAQAILVGHSMRGRSFDHVFVSPYLRTRQTADNILKSIDPMPRVHHDDRLRELEFGILDGLTPDGIRAKYPEEIERRKKEGKYYYRPPGGESRPDMGLRLDSFLQMLCREHPLEDILIVAHSVVVLMFRKLLEHWDEATYMHIDKTDDVKNCSVTRYRHLVGDGRMLIEHYNRIFYSLEEPHVTGSTNS
jgi:broad specificity phosphatase PhoE